MNIAPDLVQKADIILNAVYLAQLLGIEEPDVAVLAATELVNPDMQATMDAAVLSKMCERRQFPACCVDGPFALDNAVSELAAQTKRIDGPVAGKADILLVPNIEAGNMLAKSFVYLAQGNVAGVLVGASAPVVLTSRADSADAKLYSIATAMLMADLRRTSRLKIGKVHF
jgi:phosphate butyryltransferase